MKKLTRQLVIRVDDELETDLEEVAAANERTIAQEVRFRLRRPMEIQRLELGPDDALVVITGWPVTMIERERIVEDVRARIGRPLLSVLVFPPKTDVMVIDGGDE